MARGCGSSASSLIEPVHTFERSSVTPASRLNDAVGERAQLLGPAAEDQEVVLETQAAASLPVVSWLDCKNHPDLHLAPARLVCVRRLARAPTPWQIGCVGWPG